MIIARLVSGVAGVACLTLGLGSDTTTGLVSVRHDEFQPVIAQESLLCPPKQHIRWCSWCRWLASLSLRHLPSSLLPTHLCTTTLGQRAMRYARLPLNLCVWEGMWCAFACCACGLFAAVVLR